MNSLNRFIRWHEATAPSPTIPFDLGRIWWWVMRRSLCEWMGHNPMAMDSSLRPTIYVCRRCRCVGTVELLRVVRRDED